MSVLSLIAVKTLKRMREEPCENGMKGITSFTGSSNLSRAIHMHVEFTGMSVKCLSTR